MVAGGFVVLGALLLVRSSRIGEANGFRALDREALVNVGATLVAFVLYALLLIPLGFILASIFVIAFLSTFYGNRNIFLGAAVSIGVPLLIFFTFTRLLRVSLPETPFLQRMYDSFLQGIELALRLDTFVVMAGGLLLGMFVGALPGFTTVMAMAILLPLSFFFDPLVGIPFLIGVYKGGIYGGSIPAILVSMPGTDAQRLPILRRPQRHVGPRVGHDRRNVAALEDGYADSDLFSPAEQAAIAWAEHLTMLTYRQHPAAMDALKQHYSVAQIVEITMVSGFLNFWNRFNDGLQMDPEGQQVTELFKRSVKIDPAAYVAFMQDCWWGEEAATWAVTPPVSRSDNASGQSQPGHNRVNR